MQISAQLLLHSNSEHQHPVAITMHSSRWDELEEVSLMPPVVRLLPVGQNDFTEESLMQ